MLCKILTCLLHKGSDYYRILSAPALWRHRLCTDVFRSAWQPSSAWHHGTWRLWARVYQQVALLSSLKLSRMILYVMICIDLLYSVNASSNTS